MNYLAHLFFAEDTPHSRIGNLLGDFCRGVDLKQLHPQILVGLQQHRAVDVFTDRSTEILAAKQYFSPQRRRFAGIALDMLFDHFLIRHWPQFHPQPFLEYKSWLYQQLQSDLPLMPASMQPTVQSIIRRDWFLSYADIHQLGLALDRVAQRIRFANQFAGAGMDIQAHYLELERLFLQFFPRLQHYVKSQSWLAVENAAR
ncbi:MAG: ACP phosphodiesterase [Rheinheimera sp.]